MEDVAEEGMTVLVSSHNLRELEDVCDHVGASWQRGRCLLEKSVSELQETTTKVLLALPDGAALPEEGLDILHRSSTGKLQTLILRGREEDNLAWLEKLHPLFMDSVPLTLEEIFIYEREVWTMPSERTFFNKAVYKRALSRFWIIGAAYAVVLCFLTLMCGQYFNSEFTEVSEYVSYSILSNLTRREILAAAAAAVVMAGSLSTAGCSARPPPHIYRRCP